MSHKKTLCLIANAASPHTQKWVEGCTPLNWRIIVISHWPGEIAGAHVIHFPLTLSGFPQYCWKFRSLIQKINPDIIHAHEFGAHALYALFSGIKPVVVSAWGSDILVRPKKSWFYRCLVKFIIRKTAKITADSNQIVRELIHYGAKPGQILNFPFGIQRNIYEELQENFPLKNPFVICSPRLHEPVYNIHTIIEAFERISSNNPLVQLWILGEGSLTPELKGYVRDKGLHQVIFWGKMTPAESLAKIALSSILVSVPRSDGTPVSMLEAMAAGSFPIVSDLPVYHDWITDGTNGLIVNPNVTDLASALQKGIEDGLLLEQAVRINRALVKEKAIWEDQFREMLNYYREITGICGSLTN